MFFLEIFVEKNVLFRKSCFMLTGERHHFCSIIPQISSGIARAVSA